jgi:hypothetical protein
VRPAADGSLVLSASQAEINGSAKLEDRVLPVGMHNLFAAGRP